MSWADAQPALASGAVDGQENPLTMVTILWGPQELRFPLMTLEWPEEEAKIEGKERVKLEEEYGLRLSDASGVAKPAPAAKPQAAAPVAEP